MEQNITVCCSTFRSNMDHSTNAPHDKNMIFIFINFYRYEARLKREG